MAGRKKWTHIPVWGLPFWETFARLNGILLCFLTASYLWFTKQPGIQTQVRWLFWDASLPSSPSASSPNKVIFLASAPHLWFIGFISLSCSEQSVLGLSNRGRAQALGEQMEQLANLFSGFVLKNVFLGRAWERQRMHSGQPHIIFTLSASPPSILNWITTIPKYNPI